jgi:hypothetical protein
MYTTDADKRYIRQFVKQNDVTGGSVVTPKN